MEWGDFEEARMFGAKDLSVRSQQKEPPKMRTIAVLP